MKVTIGDLDYYYAAEKRDQFNPDVMKISSFHKQSGDQINFVVKKDDIYRPYDLYYIIKEEKNTPNPPTDFYCNPNVRGGGAAFKRKINGRMSDVMLACRPDYLLYPEKNTKFERAEQVRLLNDKGNILPITQDWHNSYKNKKVLVTDTAIWTTKRENLIYALKKLQDIQNVTFYEPIWLPKLANDEEVIELFLQLKLTRNSNITFVPITFEMYQDCAVVIERIKKAFPSVAIGPLILKNYNEDHWLSKDAALQDWNALKEIILDAKSRQIMIELKMLKSRYETPYFLLFETVSNGTKFMFKRSGLEGITSQYGPALLNDNIMFWCNPHKGSDVFRDLVRQTYQDQPFMITQGGKNKLSINDIPGTVGKEEFKYGI